MSVTPVRPNNDLISNKIITRPKDTVRSLVRFEGVCRWPEQVADNKMDEDTLMPCSIEGPPSGMGGKKIGCRCTNIVSKKTTSTTECSPHAVVDPTLLAPSSACPTQVGHLHLLTGELALSFIVNETNRQSTLMPCSPRAKLSAPSTSVSPASPNNDLISHKIIGPDSSAPPERNPGEESLLIKAEEEPECSNEHLRLEKDLLKLGLPDATAAKWPSQEAVNRDTTSVRLHLPYILTAPSPLASQHISEAQAVGQWLGSKPNLLLTKVLGDKEARPDQTAISKRVNSTRWYSQESTVAHMPPTNEPVS
jgi:hypothetical protein